MIAAHTDSPCLKVKPISKRNSKDSFLQVAVETYGGGLWYSLFYHPLSFSFLRNTWFDRDLGIAGRITLRNEKDGHLSEKLVNIPRYSLST